MLSFVSWRWGHTAVQMSVSVRRCGRLQAFQSGGQKVSYALSCTLCGGRVSLRFLTGVQVKLGTAWSHGPEGTLVGPAVASPLLCRLPIVLGDLCGMRGALPALQLMTWAASTCIVGAGCGAVLPWACSFRAPGPGGRVVLRGPLVHELLILAGL